MHQGKATLTKQDLVEAVCQKSGVMKSEAANLVDLIFDTLKVAMKTEDKIKISGFGNFTIRNKKARMGRNPQTGEKIEITPRRVVTFSCSSVLRSEVNGATAE